MPCDPDMGGVGRRRDLYLSGYLPIFLWLAITAVTNPRKQDPHTSTAVRLAPRSGPTPNMILLAVALLVLQALVGIRFDAPLRSSESVSSAPGKAAAGGIAGVAYGRLPAASRPTGQIGMVL